MANNKFEQVGRNISEKAALIWNVADMLRGPFKPHEYGLVILPMTVIKRFHDCLLPTHDEVLATFEKIKKLDKQDGFLRKASGYQFYNTSKFTFETLLADPENIEANFKDYLAGFSANVQDIIAKFEFDAVIKRMVESNTLYLTIKEFNKENGYLGPDKISSVDCGYIFEDLVRRFSESFGEDAGAHFTSRDIIYLMTDILLSGNTITAESNLTVYDMTMGTSQMLGCMEERIKEINKDATVTLFGQEYNPSTFAIAKADMMIRGGNPNNMRFGDTLSEDQFKDYTFNYCISNPPFGIDWKKEEQAVKAEHKKGNAGRFGAGLPKISDGQQLFVLNGLSKMSQTGKMAIIQNGSPLFSGDAESGPSNIRKYIMADNDWLEAIIQLSTDQFMNTGISTYIWVLNKDKPAKRAGKVQLIDASHCYEQRRKSIGNKRNDITDRCRDLIVLAYKEFENNQLYGEPNGVYCESKIFDVEDFGYRKITVERPLRWKVNVNFDTLNNFMARCEKENIEFIEDDNCLMIPLSDTPVKETSTVLTPEDISAFCLPKTWTKKDADRKFTALYNVLLCLNNEKPYMDYNKFVTLFDCYPWAKKEKIKWSMFEKVDVYRHFVETDPSAAPVLKKGLPVPDPSLRDTENVPLKESVEKYFKREVLPYAPDAWIDESKTKIGYEIPMTRYFYKYVPPEKSEDILARIKVLEKEIDESIGKLV